MRRTGLGVVLGALVSLQGVEASLPRGVGPEFAKYYDSKDTFTCINTPSIKIPSSQVNDNSCDCPDGSDEPGTAACAFIDPLSPPQPLPGAASGTTNTTQALPGFWCTNVGHVGAYLPSMYVNDGICDHETCCDGTDEFTGAKCPNRCAEMGREWRRIEAERQAAVERSGAARQDLVRKAKAARRNVEIRISNFKIDIAALEIKKVDLERKLEEIERKERRRVVKGPKKGGDLGVLKELAKNRVDELRDGLEVAMSQRDEVQDKVDQLELILEKLKEEYNPNYNDAGVKTAVRAWEDYSSNQDDLTPEMTDSELLGMMVRDDENNGINWDEFEEPEEDDVAILYRLEEYIPYSLKKLIYGQIDNIKTWLVDSGVLATGGAKQTESKAVTEARKAATAASSDLSTKQAKLVEEEKDLARDYGPDEVFRGISDRCITKDAGEYTYELCWMGSTTQKSKKGHGNVAMGKFERIDREESDEDERHDGKGLGTGQRMVLRYLSGQACWNGPRRETHVWLACAEKEELWRVTESEKCIYKMEVGTPAACEHSAEIKPVDVKDEL